MRALKGAVKKVPKKNKTPKQEVTGFPLWRSFFTQHGKESTLIRQTIHSDRFFEYNNKALRKIRDRTLQKNLLGF
jgi:hypothetical protein